MIILTDLRDSAMEYIGEAKNLLDQSQQLRKKSLYSYKRAGEALATIKSKLNEAGASRYNPVETDLGVYTSLKDFLKKNDINEKRALDYIFLFENWSLAEEIQLLENEACYRLVRSLYILKWAKAKKEEDPNWTGTVEDYWEESKSSNNDKPSYKDLQKETRRLENMVEGYEENLKQLQSKLKGYEENNERLQKEVERYKRHLDRERAEKEKLEDKLKKRNNEDIFQSI
jgi:hypothetical protein